MQTDRQTHSLSRASTSSQQALTVPRPSTWQVDGAPVRQVEDLLSAVEVRQVGEAVTLRVLRGCDPQREETLKVRLGSAR